ncbi:MAG TPA: hypothetical protein DCF33_09735 [Saprospirales bacterium]|nr:hypothetical protein [Saprospirales bacterium]
MKALKFFPFLSFLLLPLFSLTLSAQEEMDETLQDSTGLPGDHFSLEAAIELFKKSDSPEDFEKRLNAENNDVNNLDLNEDGKIDYIRVEGRKDGDAHALVLQAVMGENEVQDVAVIEIEKQGDENAVLQIIGDENVYGEQVFAEPFEDEKAGNGRNKGPEAQRTPVRIIVNVWLWRPVRFMYAPGYRVWVSPWRWGVYPTWWRPWRPYPWGVFHVRVRPYRAHCHIVNVHRVHRAHAVYAPHRRHSTVVHTRTTTVVKARGPHGGKVAAKRTTTTTKSRNGRVQETKTTTVGKKGRNGTAGARKTTTTNKPRGRRN